MPSWPPTFSEPRLRRPAALLPLALATAVSIAAPLASADVSGEGYRIRAPRSLDVIAGSERTASVTILPSTGFTISRDGPVVIELEPEPGIEVVRRRFEREDAADPRAEAPRFELRVRGAQAGRHRLRVSARFWLCRKRVCRPIASGLEIAVTVGDPSPPPDAGPDAGAGAPPAGGDGRSRLR